MAVQPGPAGPAHRDPRRRAAGLQRRGAGPRPRAVRPGMRDRHPGSRDRLPWPAGPAVERVPDGAGEGASSRVSGALLQRRLHPEPGRRGDSPPPQGGAAAPGRALGDPAQCVGQVDRVVRPQPGRVLSGGRHRDRPPRFPDGQRGLLSGERSRPGDERRGGGLPWAVSAPARRQRPVRGTEPRPRPGQQPVPDRVQCRDVLPERRLRRPHRYVRRRLARYRLPRADCRAARLQRRILLGRGNDRHQRAAPVPRQRAVGQLAQRPHHRAVPADLRRAGLPEEPLSRPRPVRARRLSPRGDRKADPAHARARRLGAPRQGRLTTGRTAHSGRDGGR